MHRRGSERLFQRRVCCRGEGGSSVGLQVPRGRGTPVPVLAGGEGGRPRTQRSGARGCRLHGPFVTPRKCCSVGCPIQGAQRCLPAAGVATEATQNGRLYRLTRSHVLAVLPGFLKHQCFYHFLFCTLLLFFHTCFWTAGDMSVSWCKRAEAALPPTGRCLCSSSSPPAVPLCGLLFRELVLRGVEIHSQGGPILFICVAQ